MHWYEPIAFVQSPSEEQSSLFVVHSSTSMHDLIRNKRLKFLVREEDYVLSMVHLSICPFVCVFIFLTFPAVPSVYFPIFLSVNLSVCPSHCLSICPTVNPSVLLPYFPFCLSCPSVLLFSSSIFFFISLTFILLHIFLCLAQHTFLINRKIIYMAKYFNDVMILIF